MVGKEKAMVIHIKWVNVAYMISVSLVGFSSPTVQAKDLEKLRALKAKVIPSKGIKEFEEKRLKALEEMQQDHDETEAMLRNIGKALRTDADKKEKVKDKKTIAEQAKRCSTALTDEKPGKVQKKTGQDQSKETCPGTSHAAKKKTEEKGQAAPSKASKKTAPTEEEVKDKAKQKEKQEAKLHRARLQRRQG